MGQYVFNYTYTIISVSMAYQWDEWNAYQRFDDACSNITNTTWVWEIQNKPRKKMVHVQWVHSSIR